MNIKGLTDKEVKESRAKYGSNEIPDSEADNILAGV